MNCQKCGRQMRTHRDRDANRPVHMGRGLCRRCYREEQRAGRIEQWEPAGPNAMDRATRAAMVEDVEWMRDTGEHPLRWAPRLGTNHQALSRRLYRAGRRDLAHEIDRVLRGERSAA